MTHCNTPQKVPSGYVDSQPEISMAFTSGFLTASLGTVTVRTPFSILALTWSSFAFSGNLRTSHLTSPVYATCHLSLCFSLHFFASPTFLYLHLDFLFLQPWKISLENMSLGGLFPVYAGVGKCRCFAGELWSWGRYAGEGKVLERVPDVKRERIKDVTSSATKEGARDDRHFLGFLLERKMKIRWAKWKLADCWIGTAGLYSFLWCELEAMRERYL